MTARRPASFIAAYKAWPRQFEVTLKDPTGENLDVLCGLLDVMDNEMARGDGNRNPARLEAFLLCRGDAARANQAVSGAVKATNKRKAAQTKAAKEKKHADV